MTNRTATDTRTTAHRMAQREAAELADEFRLITNALTDEPASHLSAIGIFAGLESRIDTLRCALRVLREEQPEWAIDDAWRKTR